MNKTEKLIKIIVNKTAPKTVTNAYVVSQDIDGKFVIEFDGNSSKRRSMPDPGLGLIVGNWVSCLVPDGDINQAQIVGIADVLVDTLEDAWG